jgi:hypothetical protein
VIGWAEAGRGVLVTGAAPADAAGAAGQLAHAAIRLRKPVIVVDLAAGPGLPGLLAAAAAAAGAPLLTFTAAGPGCYEPFPAGDPARNAALAVGMIDWAGQPGAARQASQSVLADIFAVAGAVPAGGGRAVLDDVVALLGPGALQARMARVPGYWPDRAGLAARVAASAARLAADPAAASGLAGQLAGVRASPLGRWLGGAPRGDGSRISLPSVIRQRGVVLFSLDRATHGPVAGIIASLVAKDLAALAAGLGQTGTGGDGLAWFSQCDAADPHALAALVSAGAGAGLATVLSTTSVAAAAGLAGQAGVLVVHRLADCPLASQLAGLTGQHLVPAGPGSAGQHLVAAGPGSAGMVAAGPRDAALPMAAPPGTCWAPVVTSEAMCALPAGEFVLIRPGITGGVVPRAVSVPARIPVARQPGPGGRRAGPRGRAGPPPGPPRAARRQAPVSPGDGTGSPSSEAVPPAPADALPAPADALPAPDAPPAAAPAAAPGAPPWPNAPAWAGGQLRRDRLR